MKKLLLALSLSVSLFALDKQMEFAQMMHQGDDFISKEEYSNIVENIKKVNDIHKGPHHFLIMLTSETVPNGTMFNILHSLAVLQDNGYPIHSKQYLMGPPEDFQEYMMKIDSDVKRLHPSLSVQEKIKRNFGLKIDPRFFDLLKAKRVPMLAAATCPSMNPDPEKCSIHYYMTGDVGLLKFLDRISEENRAFEPMVQTLRTNGF